MKNILEYIIQNNYEYLVLNEYSKLEGYEMINESFKSSIVQKLAQAIYDAEKENNQKKVARAKKEDQDYPRWDGSKHNPNLTNFASIFGPRTEQGRYKTTKGIQGLKWSEITDDDFKEYSPNDKELIKLIKSSYGKDGQADFIIMKDDKIINFIKAYGGDKKTGKVFYFKTGSFDAGVKVLTKRYYTYQYRDLKVSEVIDMLDELSKVEGVKVYALEITSDMIKDYKDLRIGRENSQEGVINYDKASLEQLLKQQKARYSALADEMRAKKLMGDPKSLFDDIKKVNNDVVELYQTIMAKPEYIDKSFDLGRLITYTSYAYDCYYKYVKSLRQADKAEERAKQRGSSDDEAKKWRSYEESSAQESINDVKEYLDKIKKLIEDIKKNL